MLNRYFLYVFTILIAFGLFLQVASAQDWRSVVDKGLRGEELICLTVYPKDKNILFVGTSRGLYVKRTEEEAWLAVKGLPAGSCRVYQVVFGDTAGYVATNKGLFELDVSNFTCRNIFDRSDDSERNCLSVCVLKNGFLFAGTQSGLFVKKKGQKTWRKQATYFDEKEIVCLSAALDTAYALTVDGILRTRDDGKLWEKIFDKISYDESVSETDEGDAEFEITRGDIRYICVAPDNPFLIYAATTSGVFLSDDAGDNWRRLSLTGVNYSELRFIRVSAEIRKIFVVSKNNVYEFKENSWQSVAGLYDCRQVDEGENRLFILTGRDIFERDIPSEGADQNVKPRMAQDKNDILKIFANEPTVQDVQKKAIEYSETSNKKIDNWRRRANIKAIMPKLTFGYDNNVYGSYNGYFAVGPNSWDVSVSWDFSELIYNDDQTSIDTRSKLMVQLRNDILAEVTSLFFERRRLQVELVVKEGLSEQEKIDKKLRISELTALLDRLTGGFYSNALQDVIN